VSVTQEIVPNWSAHNRYDRECDHHIARDIRSKLENEPNLQSVQFLVLPVVVEELGVRS